MLFNSVQFFIFFAVFYAVFLVVRRHLVRRNVLLLCASYIFYASWNWHFLSLIIISTLVDFTLARRMSRYGLDDLTDKRKRQLLFMTSLIVNLGILGTFKYFNFFVDSFAVLMDSIGLQSNMTTLSLLLPVGISFYTFQTMSYTFDVYRGKLESVDSLLDFAVFVAFFPQLVAGPIERASNLLPQIQSVRPIHIQQIHTGIYLIIWGLFQKMVIADHAAVIANEVFNHHAQYQGIDILIGVLAFTFQIYGDFSGYSDIARGVSKLMGIELMVNFRLPYFAMNPSDFWNRWHISLSTWLRDYLYIPLGGNRKGQLKTYRNLMITMVLGGLWHGAAWNFVIWGFYHGAILILYRVFERKPMHANPWSGGYNYGIVVMKMAFMFALTMLGWLIFRVESLPQLVDMLASMTQVHTLSIHPQIMAQSLKPFALHMSIFGVLIFWQYLKRNLLVVIHTHWVLQSVVLFLLIVWIIVFGVRESAEFIYFQF
jgi:D-alanyl-lipoteichoic acid acyltransferase DltB (MBOAT superfamily)